MAGAARGLVGLVRRRASRRGLAGAAGEPGVLLSEQGGLARIVLNRPKALNALNLDMIRALSPQLRRWAEGGEVRVVMIRGAGEKAFCAGGDIRAITEVPGGDLQRQFFMEEYQLDHLVGTYSLPYVAILNGIVMGGGVGLSVNGRWRVATERAVFAMPETAIGLIPDVGGGHFLPRLRGHLGMFLGLTGHRLKGWDCLAAGLATHAVRGEEVERLEDAMLHLASTDQAAAVEGLLEEFTPPEAKQHNFSLEEHMETIDRVFSAASVEEVVAGLEQESSKFASKALAALRSASPTSLKVAFRQIREGAELGSLGEVLAMEHRLVTRCCQDTDFYEGVRAALVDRDNRPAWSPATLEEVTGDMVDRYFSPLEQDRELLL